MLPRNEAPRIPHPDESTRQGSKSFVRVLIASDKQYVSFLWGEDDYIYRYERGLRSVSYRGSSIRSSRLGIYPQRSWPISGPDLVGATG